MAASPTYHTSQHTTWRNSGNGLTKHTDAFPVPDGRNSRDTAGIRIDKQMRGGTPMTAAEKRAAANVAEAEAAAEAPATDGGETPAENA